MRCRRPRLGLAPPRPVRFFPPTELLLMAPPVFFCYGHSSSPSDAERPSQPCLSPALRRFREQYLLETHARQPVGASEVTHSKVDAGERKINNTGTSQRHHLRDSRHFRLNLARGGPECRGVAEGGVMEIDLRRPGNDVRPGAELRSGSEHILSVNVKGDPPEENGVLDVHFFR